MRVAAIFDASREEGFSLLEMLVVLAIVGLVAMVVVPHLRSSNRLQLDSFAETLASKLRFARATAVGQNREMSVRLDKATRTLVSSADPKSMPIPTNLSIEMNAVAARTAGKTAILFFPDGSGSGGSIDLRQDNRAVAVLVNWLTGDIEIEPRR